MPNPRKVALLIETDRAYGRGLLRGIARYNRLHGPWTFYVEPGTIARRIPNLKKWGCEGIVARIPSRRMAADVAALKLPAVVLGYEVAAGQVRLGTRSETEGRMAAQHLLDRGLRQFAFCGFAEQVYSERLAGFTARLAEAGCEVHVYRRAWKRRDHWQASEQQDLFEWIASLAKPLGLFACNDDQGRRVLNACQAAGIAVPEDVAVLGVDDDELLCELCRPPMSSIALATEKAGFEAAAALDLMMAGQKPRQSEIIVEPLRVVGAAIDRRAGDRRRGRGPRRAVHSRACGGADPRGGRAAGRADVAAAGRPFSHGPGPLAQRGNPPRPSRSGEHAPRRPPICRFPASLPFPVSIVRTIWAMSSAARWA